MIRCYMAILLDTRNRRIVWQHRLGQWEAYHDLYSVVCSADPTDGSVLTEVRIKANKLGFHFDMSSKGWELLHWNILKGWGKRA